MKSRREKRKEARKAKSQLRNHLWVLHQAGKRKRAQKEAGEEEPVLKAKEGSGGKAGEAVLKVKEDNGTTQKISTAVVPDVERTGRRRNGLHKDDKKEKKGKSKFEEFLERDMKKTALLNAEADLLLERRLAKKLKVKGGKLRGFDDGIDDILDGFGEGAEILETEEDRSKKVDTIRKDDFVLGSDEEGEEDAIHMDDSVLKSDEEGDEDDGIHMDDSGSGSDEVLEEGGEDEANDSDEEGEEDEANDFVEEREENKVDDSLEEGEDEAGDSDDSKDVPAVDGEKHQEEKLTEKSKQNDDGATDVYGRKKVDATVRYVPPHLRGKASDASEEMVRIQRRVRGMI